VAANDVSFWEHSAYCVTASIILCLQLLYPHKDALDHGDGGHQDKKIPPLLGGADHQKYYDLVSSTRERLASRRGDIIAKRGVRLIDTMLSVGGLPGFSRTPAAAFTPVRPSFSQEVTTSDVRIDLQEIVAQFLAGDVAAQGWDCSPTAEPPADMDLMDVDFDTWFEGIFRAPGS
jgi:hypothetical protein